MPKPNVCVLRAPGTNCDVETEFAFEQCGANAERVHLFRLLDGSKRLDDYQILCVPGGFSYGDDIGAGVIFSRKLSGRLGGAIEEFLQHDKLVLGICNGFQVLLKAGILPGNPAVGGDAEPNTTRESLGSRPGDGGVGRPERPRDPANEPPATLTWNDNGKYTAVWVRLRVCSDRNVFLRGISEIDLPVAHAEGKFAVRDRALLDQWLSGGQIALCYTENDGGDRAQPSAADPQAFNGSRCVGRRLPFPENPNGSEGNVAGLGDATGRVLGLMPHPERFLFATQHPQWTRRRMSGEGDGMKLFGNAVEYFG